ANASRISEVPTATPSLRSSSQKLSSFAARPGGPASAFGPKGEAAKLASARRLGGRLGQLQADALGDEVDVGAVLDQDRHRLVEGVGVDVLGARQQQRLSPIG